MTFGLTMLCNLSIFAYTKLAPYGQCGKVDARIDERETAEDDGEAGRSRRFRLYTMSSSAGTSTSGDWNTVIRTFCPASSAAWSLG